MFRRLYIAIVPFVAIGIAIGILVFSMFQQSENVGASTTIPISSNDQDRTIEVVTDAGVLDQVATNVSITVTGTNDAHLQLAIGHYSDIVSWLGKDNYLRIKGLKTWSELEVANGSTDDYELNGIAAPEEGNAYSDMWSFYAKNNHDISTSWLKKSDISWSALITAQAPEGNNSDITITLSWKKSSDNFFLLPGLLLSLMLLISCLLLYLLGRNKVKQGGHAGESKKLVDMINIGTSEFALPQSSQIPSVKEFAKISQNMNSGSLLTTGTTVGTNNDPFNSASNFYASPVSNDDWRYYGDSAPNREYYESSISHNVTVENLAEANSVLNTNFEVASKLDEIGLDRNRSLTRKELRKSKGGLFTRSNPKKETNEKD